LAQLTLDDTAYQQSCNGRVNVFLLLPSRAIPGTGLEPATGTALARIRHCPFETFRFFLVSPTLVSAMTLPQNTRTFLAFLFLIFASALCAEPAAAATAKNSGLVAAPASIDFGRVQVGQSKTQFETLTNNATNGLTVYSSTMTGAGFTVSGLTLPLTIAAGQSYTFSLTFTPQTSGAASGSLGLSSRNGHAKLAVALTGNATANGTLTVSPATLNFGNVTVGTGKPLQASLGASGTSVQVSSGTISTSEFTISGITFPVTIAAGSSVPFTMTFAPQASGTATATASFASDASNSPTAQTLTGTGVAAPQHDVTLQWSPSNSQDVVGYNVYRGATTGGPYTKLNPALDASTAYDDGSVASGQTYYYVTTAVDNTGLESTYSNQVKAVIPTP
jgi:hypothetical protein